MPMMSKTPGNEMPGKSVREIEEMIRAIEQYLQKTREVIDRIEKDIAELKKESKGRIEKSETIHLKKGPTKEAGRSL